MAKTIVSFGSAYSDEELDKVISRVEHELKFAVTIEEKKELWSQLRFFKREKNHTDDRIRGTQPA